MPVTNPRPGRTWRTLLAAQSAKGTPVSNFTTATQTWATMTDVQYGNDQIEPDWWMTTANADHVRSRYNVKNLGGGQIEGHATPALASILLQSLFGPYAANSFTLVGYVNKWLSLALIEDKTLTNGSLRLVRPNDALIHELMVSVDSTGYCELRAAYAAEATDTTTLNNLAALGVTLPAAPMESVDHNVFAGRAATLRRDPAGANVAVPFDQLSLLLSVNLDGFWDQMGRRTRAVRRGPLTTSLIMTSRAGDESWQLALDSAAGTSQTYALTLTDAPSGHALTFTLYGMTFNVSRFGVKDQEYPPMVARGMATQNLSGNFVGITLT